MVKLIDRLTIGMFQKIHSLSDDMLEVTKGLNIVSIIEGVSPEEVRKWPIKRYKDVLTMYTTIDFSAYEKTHVKKLTIAGERYKVIDNPAKLTAGQLIDTIETMKTSDQPIEYMDRALAIICKKGRSYDSDGLAQRSQDIKEVLIRDVWGIWVFFFNLWIRYCDVSEAYLSEQMTTSLKEAKSLLSSQSGLGS